MTALFDKVPRRKRVDSVTDEYGNTVPGDWSTAPLVPLPDSEIQPLNGSEYTVDRDAITSLAQYWCANVDVDLKATDRIVDIDDIEYLIDGPVQRWRGRLSHATCLLKRTDG